MSDSRNLYELLDIPTGASPDDIERTIALLRRAWAPLQRDPNRRDEAIAWLELLAEAEAVLTDPARRRDHDRGLAGSVPVPQPPPVPVGRSRSTGLVVIAAAVVAILLVGGAIAVAGSGNDDDGERETTLGGAAPSPDDSVPEPDDGSRSTAEIPTSPPGSASDSTAGTEPPPATPDSPPPTMPQPTSPPVRTARVSRTCGDGGGGDCFLSVRSAADTNSSEVRRLAEGATLEVSCQDYGESVYSSVLGARSPVWVQTSDGHYVAGVFLDVDGWDLFTVTTPC